MGRWRSLWVAIALVILAVDVQPSWAPGSGEAGLSSAVEMRGAWARYCGIPNWDETIRRLHEANFNAVFPYVCSAGVAYYPSSILPPSETAGPTDYLAAATSAGRRYGVEVHARMLVLETLFAAEATKLDLARQGRLMQDAKGKSLPWLCPTNPYNREQVVGVATEIVRNYPVAGLQLDYIRYPHQNCCFCEHCRHKFIHDTGAYIQKWPQDVISGSYKEAFNSWRRQQITSLVAEITAAAKLARPQIVVSAAVFPDWPSASNRFGQDAASWAERGLVDFICPMNYTANIGTLIGWLQQQMTMVGGRVPVVVGLGPFSDSCQFDGPHQLLDQILIGRDEGAGGFVVFNYNQQFAHDYLPYLAMGVTSSPASTWLQPSLARPVSVSATDSDAG